MSGGTPGAGEAFDPVVLAEIRRLLGVVDERLGDWHR